MDSVILKKLESIEKMLTEQNTLKKEVISFNEAAIYLELSHSHLYKLTAAGSIPHYKPNGKKVYFKRLELDSWLLRNRTDSKEEIDQAITDFQLKQGRNQL
ncbi:helix-turn-helix domain-containing protein [Plebeiibacterium sediminum]|uniref:Helix-turn-helix domain-containing protein n=1 Tax=Plebeiibacterium sediminum TaxID=2992112 RepID=A0AAE3M1C2_9BACT|nr:helix-turn-helix domain-containing protein [Plebeiobacterium sediminum]MCW3785486.1 helix-turn-helix domain-containing protein [Plebeiobacterium sediminum]